ncbi:exopolysaccharide biosynthesis protein [Staphylococcus aureus]|uniref:exopolysaccharide biosynthesis protein n=1 Tax=Staphylococcus aureus TaxID=1280 RepID=UPI003CC7EB5F
MLLIGIAVILGRLPWLPERVLDHALPSDTVQKVLHRGAESAQRFEHLVKPRLLALPMSGSRAPAAAPAARCALRRARTRRRRAAPGRPA